MDFFQKTVDVHPIIQGCIFFKGNFRGVINFEPLPKFPAITRDLSLLCDDAVPVGSLEETIQQAAGKLLEQVTLFDVYKGDQIADGKKSVSFSLRLRSHEGTLTDEQADAAMKRVLKALAAKDVTLRD